MQKKKKKKKKKTYYSKSVGAFKKLIKCEKKENSIFSIYNSFGVKFLTGLRLQFNHLNEHKFRHGFGDTRNPMCEHLPLRCNLYSLQRLELFENFGKVVYSF